jgi:glycosyltransferase involved in cell wall biosynthesis
MIKILFLEQFSEIGGGQTVLLSILESLDRNKYTPIVALPKEGPLSKRLEQLNVKYFIYPLGEYSLGRKSIFDVISYFFNSIKSIFILNRLIKSQNIQLIYANATRAFLPGTISAKLNKIPIVWHLHLIVKGIEKWTLLFLLKCFKINRIIAVSDITARSLLKNNGFDIVHNAVDTQKFSPLIEGNNVRQELNINPSVPIVGFIGSLVKLKGIEHFISATKSVASEFPSAKFLIVGDTLAQNKNDYKYKKDLLELVKNSGMENKVVFTGKRNDIPSVLAALDILVVPSIQPETFSMVLLEAMATGRPVVAADHGGPREIIEHNKDGILYSPRDDQALASAVLDLLKNPKKSSEIGKFARTTAENRFSIQRFRHEIGKVIDSVVGNHY